MSREYASDKLSKFPLYVNQLQSGHPQPLHVQLILSDLCNQNCIFCAYRSPGYQSSELFYENKPEGGGLRLDVKNPERNYNPNRMIPLEKAREVILDCKSMGVKAIQMTGGGEPTMHPQHEELFALALESGLECALVSNGVNWSDHLIRNILPKFAWVRISVDASDERAYRSIRNVPRAHWVKMLRHVAAFSKVKSDCVFGIGFVITRENYKQIVEAVVLAKHFGADNIRLGGCFTTEGASYYDGIVDEIRMLVAEAYKHEDDNFTVFARWPEKLDDLLDGSPDYHDCTEMRITAYVAGDQNVYTCCNNAYNPRGLIGSIKEQSFAQLWDVDARKFFSTFDARKCNLCQFNEKNRSALDTLAAPSRHDVFV